MCYFLMNGAVSLGSYFYQPNSVITVIWFLFVFIFGPPSVHQVVMCTWKESNATIGFVHSDHYPINRI